jgi:TonB-dependent receptor
MQTLPTRWGRLMGVTLERDEGEGKYVQIRGTEPRLSNTTIDGVLAPSPEAQVNQIKLDTIPADLVESVEINKTLSANQDGDAIGGSVNLVTKTAGSTPTLTAFGSGGYTPIIDGRHASQYGITAGKRFLPNAKLGVLGNFTYDYNGRGIDDIEPSPDPGFLTPMYDSIDLREYRYDRTRWGTAGSVDYKLSEGSLLFAKVFYSDFKDYGDKWVYTLNAGAFPPHCDPTDPDNPCGDTPKYSTSKRAPDYGLGVLTIGGNHLLTNSWLKWDADISRARQLAAAGNPGAKFKAATSTLKDFAANNCYYDPSANPSQYRPEWNAACTAKGSPVFDPTQWKLSELDLTSGQTTQINLQGSAAYGLNYHLGGHFSTFEFGAKVRNQHKGQFAYSPTYDNEPGGIMMSQFLSSVHNDHYYDGSYKLGPLTNYDAIVAFSEANPTLFPLDVDATHIGSDASNFNLEQRITAGYLMNTSQFGKFRLQAGLRFEQTNVKTTGYQVSTNSDGSWGGTSPVNGSKSYLDVLPSVQAKYALTNNSDIRASYGRGIARPDPQDLIPYITLDTTQTPSLIGIGNPALVSEHANSYDVLFEQYLQSLGLIQVGFFYKSLSDPLVVQQTILPAGSPYAGYKQTQPANAGSAWVYGIELAYQQRLTFLPGVLGGLGFSGNYTYSDSRAKSVDPLRTDSPALLRQTPNTWNLGPSYDKGKVSVHMGFEYNGASIYSYQYEDLTLNPDGTTSAAPQVGGTKGPFGDNYLYPHLQVDAQASYRLPKGFEVYAQGLNLTNEVFGFYFGSPQYVVQREYYHPTYGGGLRWTSHHE